MEMNTPKMKSVLTTNLGEVPTTTDMLHPTMKSLAGPMKNRGHDVHDYSSLEPWASIV